MSYTIKVKRAIKPGTQVPAIPCKSRKEVLLTGIMNDVYDYRRVTKESCGSIVSAVKWMR